jgi:hypothetical protein
MFIILLLTFTSYAFDKVKFVETQAKIMAVQVMWLNPQQYIFNCKEVIYFLKRCAEQ